MTTVTELIDMRYRLVPPGDWNQPDWSKVDKCHDWKNYVSDDLKLIWLEMSGRQRLIIAANMDDIAGREEWD